jgi:hypothetical protein
MMRTLSRPALAVGLLLLCIAFALPDAADARPLRGRGHAEVIVEGSAVQPGGDLAAEWTEPAGFQAGLGWEVGFRFRQRWPAGWAVSPSFHYVEFGGHLVDDPVEGLMDVGTRLYRYGVDVQYFFPTRRNAPGLYLSFGAALVRNKFQVDFLDYDEYLDNGANSVAGAIGLGARIGNFEISGEYNLNRVRTSRFIAEEDQLNWDYAVLRVGIALPSTY